MADGRSGCDDVKARPRRPHGMRRRLIGWRGSLAVARRMRTNGPRRPTNEQLIEVLATWPRTA